MKNLELRKELKQHKKFFQQLRDEKLVRSVIKKANSYKLQLLLRVFYEQSKSNIPIKRSTLELLKSKRKYKLFETYFGSKESYKEISDSKREHEVCLELAVCIPSLISILF